MTQQVKVEVLMGVDSIKKVQTPNLYTIGKENKAFDTQKPFSIYG